MIFSVTPEDFHDKLNDIIESVFLMDYHTCVVGKDVWGLNVVFQSLSQTYLGIMQIFILIELFEIDSYFLKWKFFYSIH